MRKAYNRHEELVKEDEEFRFEDEGNLSAALPMPEDVMENRETQRLMREIINSLPDSQRQLIVRFYYNNESIKEIASSINASESAVMTGLFRARKFELG